MASTPRRQDLVGSWSAWSSWERSGAAPADYSGRSRARQVSGSRRVGVKNKLTRGNWDEQQIADPPPERPLAGACGLPSWPQATVMHHAQMQARATSQRHASEGGEECIPIRRRR